ncbi:MAG: hypothetical protein HZRFUVUK_000303 [Candidatus Fervidibacterota bacterium]|jgi:phosphatidylglycerol:prolipoprotein diacylglycerol transferase
MHPVLIRIGSFELRTYGVCIALGLLVGLIWSEREFKDRGLPPDLLSTAALLVVPIGVVCARLLYVVLNLDEFSSNPLGALNLRSGGLSLFGALGGGISSLALICRVYNVEFWRVGDALSQGYMLAYAIGRVGCFLNGCCFGSPTRLPIGVRYYNEQGVLMPPSHPVPLYEAFGALVIFALLRWVRKGKSFSGKEMLIGLIFHLLIRFFNEFLRKGVSAKVAVAGLTQAQVACILGIILLLWIYLRRAG